MKLAKELVKALKQVSEGNDLVFLAIVISVNKNNDTCEVLYNEMEIGEVRIKAIMESVKGISIYPALNSYVLVHRLGNKGEFFISMYSEVEQVIYKIDNTIFTIQDGFLIKKNEDTLKLIFDDLIEQIKAIVVPTNVGPSGNPLNSIAFDAIKNRVEKLLK